MSSPLPCRAARRNRIRAAPSGRGPPRRGRGRRAGPPLAAAPRPAALGPRRRITPAWGKATVWMRHLARCAARASRMPSRMRRPKAGVMSAWVRISAVLAATQRRISAAARPAAAAGRASPAGRWRCGWPARPGLVRHPGQADQGLVEVEMPVGQPRQHQLAAEVMGGAGRGVRAPGGRMAAIRPAARAGPCRCGHPAAGRR